MLRSFNHHQGVHVVHVEKFIYRCASTPLVELTKCFTVYFNITSARNYVRSLMMMIDRSKHVGAF
jgi:hypothetical protein